MVQSKSDIQIQEEVFQLKSDVQLQEEVFQTLKGDSRVAGTKIGVAVEEGVVTLMGLVDSFTERWAAQEAAYRVVGVRHVVNDLQVKEGKA
jgi:osmotically-inducible protein OsmY